MIHQSKRKIQSEQHKQHLLDCAVELFMKYGYDAVSVDDIVALAGSSKGSFYYYFKSKSGVVVYYMQQWDAYYRAYYEDVLCRETCSALEKIKKLALYLLQTSAKSGEEFARIPYIYELQDSQLSANMRNRERDYFKIVQLLLQEGINDNSIRPDINMEDTASIFTITISGITLDWALSRGAYPIEEKGEPMIDIFCQSLKY